MPDRSPHPTRFTELVGVRHPIQQAAMGAVATADLAAAVRDAGALGMVAGPSGIADLRRLGDGGRVAGIGIGFIVPFLDPALVPEAAELATVVELFWAEPDPALVEAAHAGGALVSWQVGSALEAQAAEDAGVDLVVVQGVEAGGHVRASDPLATVLPATRARVTIPVVAAGGIATRADVVRLLELGADAVRVGTRLVATLESGAHPAYKAALVAAQAGDAVLTDAFAAGWPDAPHRVLRSSIDAARALDPGQPVAHLRTARGPMPLPVWSVLPPNEATDGTVEAMALYAGTSVAGVDAIARAGDVIAELAGG